MSLRALALALCPLLPLPACSGGGARQEPPLERLPRPVSLAEERQAAASVEFGLDLLREVRARSRRPNVVVSPLSVSQALGLALNGARGATFDGLRAGLALPDDPLAELNAGYRGLTRLLAELDRGVLLDVASAVFFERQLELFPEYLARVQEVFGAEAHALDFADPGAVAEINGWADAKTRGRITRILDSLSEDEVICLLNAVYFKGRWTEAFEASRTRPRPFRRADGTSIEVPMMNRGPKPTRFLYNDDVLAIELPYGRGAFTFVALLPQEGRTLDELVARLDAATWARWMGEFVDSNPSILLPRLRVEFGAGLGEALAALGMDQAFEAGRADFGALAEAGEREQLYLSRVEHRVFLEVDEAGTTAAAVTGVMVAAVSLGPEFHADRPFLMAIRERFTGTLLFLGTIGDPGRP